MRASFVAALAAVPLVVLAAPDREAAGIAWRLAEAGSWPACRAGRNEDTCPVLYLNIATRGGDAGLSVDRSCLATWRHEWGRPDAHQTIRQWLDEDAASGAGGVCIPLAPEVGEIVVASLGGHCGYEGSEANAPGPGGRLWRGGPPTLTLSGCHARIAAQGFGGIALRFADSYGVGDSYASGYFYGVYDGFGAAVVGGTEASVFHIADFNSFHYGIDILAGGSSGWRQAFPEENDR
jgi:hypothetical protein